MIRADSSGVKSSATLFGGASKEATLYRPQRTAQCSESNCSTRNSLPCAAAMCRSAFPRSFLQLTLMSCCASKSLMVVSAADFTPWPTLP
ncbi:hypothetical protein SERLADRAFT_463462 [Serpula lacrymans var. lacrymans S7.9]|uniref:Uncharacterized protein n=1 Tax=Serpula lacrymans var. lacrymans (strain S7.9) TaxID=578457 RepID=F8NSA7_SERL9|nr:uncharacterized protein SERLADRAFT_463462 [Serpula lacrymans var. lacrymans S7.9]EGO26416.1 hypothetical protein SERLADRAFT_463462 [Serpula lacrymans var. lacrymans S7.9]